MTNSRIWLALGGTLSLALSVGCGGNAACDKNATVDPSTHVGTCTVEAPKLLGDKMTCTASITSCSDAEQKTLIAALDCINGLPVCAIESQLAWETQRSGCYQSLPTLSAGCKSAVFGMYLPGEDAGFDAGPPPDAGRQPQLDGGGALSFIAVADENSFAFAWVPTQPATEVAKWELNAFDTKDATIDGGTRLPEVFFTPGNLRIAAQPDAGMGTSRTFYLAGVSPDLLQVFGGDAGAADVDAGMSQCKSAINCPTDQVCDLGQCKSQTCASTATCPPGYLCNINVTPKICLRQVSDGGVIVGPKDAGASGALPFLSAPVSVKTGVPSFTEGPVGGFQARRPDMVAMDSARQFVAVEQGGQPVGHFTINRGKDFATDDTASVIDTLGSRVHVAWNDENKTLFACYTVGTGVRVRRSFDYGRTWGAGALTLQPDDDGGAPTISDCDIASWKNGTVLVSTVESGNVLVHTVSDNLSEVGVPDIAFVSAQTDGGPGDFFNPQRTSIATLPAESQVHVGFTITRNLSGGTTDLDVVGVYRDGTTGGFTQPKFINAAGASQGNGFAQDYVTVAIDPVTKRGVAAYTVAENAGSGTYNTVYLSIFIPASRQWTTGSDLTVFVTDTSNTTSYLFPAKTGSDLWDAFSPSLAVMKDGRIWLSMLAAKRDNVADLRQYLVRFDFEATSPVAGKGWFVPPAVQMSHTTAVDPRTGSNSTSATNSCIAVDGQISVYGAMIEGVGQLKEVENRAIFISRP